MPNPTCVVHTYSLRCFTCREFLNPSDRTTGPLFEDKDLMFDSAHENGWVVIANHVFGRIVHKATCPTCV